MTDQITDEARRAQSLRRLQEAGRRQGLDATRLDVDGLRDAPWATYVTPLDPEEQTFERRVDNELLRRQVRAEASRRERQNAERGLPPLISHNLIDFLAIPDDPEIYRVDGLWPQDGRIKIDAQWKAGKSTLVANLIRSLADGDPFLDRFTVTPPAGRIYLVDDELGQNMLRRWLRDQNIRRPDRVELISIRGQVARIDLRDPQVQADWATRIRDAQASVFILDCLSPIAEALGVDQNNELGPLLTGFDAVLAQAGITEGAIVHHMGYNGERGKGDSRQHGWADASWKLVRPDEEQSSPRFFSAYGRDVDHAESQLGYEPLTRRLAIVGGSRQAAKAVELIPDIVAYVTANPGHSGRQIEGALKTLAVGTQPARRAALKIAIDRGLIDVTAGARGANFHFPITTETEPVR